MDRFGARSLDDVLASIAVPGTDPDAVSEYVVGRLTARRRRSRVLVALAAILVLLAGGTAFALSGGEDPDEVVAPATDSTEASSDEDADSEIAGAGSGSVVTAVPTTVPTTIPIPTTTFPSIAGVASNVPSYPRPGGGGASPAAGPASALPAPPTTGPTAPPDAPLEAVFEPVAAGPVAVGEVVTITLFWSDADLPEGTTAAAQLLGDSRPLPTVDGACTGGAGSSGIVTSRLSFAEAKTHAVAVEISVCGGTTQTFSTEVTVVGRADDRRPVKVLLPIDVNPESGTWTFVPDGGGDPVMIRDGEGGTDNDLRVFEGVSSVTVLAVPPEPGTIRHTDGACTREAAVGLDTTEVPVGACL